MDYEEKRKILLAYAESFPINDLPGFTNIMSVDSKYIRVSGNVLPLIGYESQDQLFETDYYSMPCPASENAEIFEKEDQLALSGEIKVISYNHFNDGWKIFLGHKKPIMHDHEAIGTLANFIDITDSNLVDISRFLWEKNNKIIKKQFSFIIQPKNIFGLTKKEQECLFYLVRGFSYKGTSKVLGNAESTIQTHTEHMKHKFKVQRKSQLIGKVIKLGFLNFIPESLLV